MGGMMLVVVVGAGWFVLVCSVIVIVCLSFRSSPPVGGRVSRKGH